jgi:hypothetical protein
VSAHRRAHTQVRPYNGFSYFFERNLVLCHPGGKIYRRYLLRESYRHNGKVKHRTIANLSHCSEEKIAAIRLALRHKGDLARVRILEQEVAEIKQRVAA